MSDAVLQARAYTGVAARRGDPKEIEAAQRALIEAKAARSIREAIDAQPALTAEQLDRLAALLRPAMRRAGA